MIDLATVAPTVTHDQKMMALWAEVHNEERLAEEIRKRDEYIQRNSTTWQDDNSPKIVLLYKADQSTDEWNEVKFVLKLLWWIAQLHEISTLPRPDIDYRLLDGIGFPIFPEAFSPLELDTYTFAMGWLANRGLIRPDVLRALKFLRKIEPEKEVSQLDLSLWNFFVAELDFRDQWRASEIKMDEQVELLRQDLRQKQVNYLGVEYKVINHLDPLNIPSYVQERTEESAAVEAHWEQQHQRHSDMLSQLCPIVFPRRKPIGYGIRNSKASCYAISLVQVLASIPAINIQYGALGEILTELTTETHFSGIYAAPLPAKYIDNVILESNEQMLSAWTEHYDQWQLGTQQDPCEFLGRLTPRYPMLRELFDFDLVYYDGLREVLGGIQSEHSYLPAPLIPNAPLISPFMLDGDDPDSHRQRLGKMPSILIFQFLIFDWDSQKGGVKLDTKLKLPEEYDMKPHFSEEWQRMKFVSSKYRLHAIIEHLGGNSTNNGHYIAMIRDTKEKNKWTLYNDQHVQQMKTPKEVLAHTERAYVAFYVKENHVQFLF
jgi:hypothetical protein